jgi:hypothetical protein
MSLLAVEGFESFGAIATGGFTLRSTMARRYTVAGSTTAGTNPEIAEGWGGGKCLKWNSTDVCDFSAMLPSANPYILVGFAYKAQELTRTPESGIFILGGQAGTVTHFRLYQHYTGHIRVTIGATTNIGATSRALRQGEWVYIELKTYTQATTGTFDIRFNGENVFSFTGTTRDGANPYISKITFMDGGINSRLDDIYIMGNTGDTDTYLGPIKVETLLPSADGAVSDWTPSANGDHYTLIEEQPVNSSTYVEAVSSGDEELFEYENTSLPSIAGIRINSDFAANGGYNTVKHRYRSGSANSYDGTTFHILDPSPVERSEILETDPDTNSAWVNTDLNAAQFGAEMT